MAWSPSGTFCAGVPSSLAVCLAFAAAAAAAVLVSSSAFIEDIAVKYGIAE